jgi:hypothetical protein
MENIYKNLQILNIDLISKFIFIKKLFLLKLKKLIICFKIKTSDNDFLINFLIISKIIYF